ncbi:hypothetical protein SK128_006400, partial [Halocaridina rubra]
MPQQYVLSVRSQKKLIDIGHLFMREKKSGENTIWICNQFYKAHCHTRVHANEDSITKRLKEHNHAGNIARVEATRLINAMEEQVITTQETPHWITTQS